MNQQAPEQLQQIDLASDLREGRFRLAEEESAKQLQRLLSVNRLETPNTTVDTIKACSRLGCEIVTVDDMMALEAIGADIEEVLKKTGDSKIEDGEKYASYRVGKEELELIKYRQGLEVTMSIDGVSLMSEDRVSKEFSRLVKERFSKSPGHVQLQQMAEGAKKGSTELSSAWFDPKEDELGSLLFLQDIGLIRERGTADQLREGRDLEDIIKQQLGSVPEYVATVQDTESEIIYTWGEGVYQYLIVDKTGGQWRYALRTNPNENYLEKANQSPAKEIPFIDTECAKQMLDWMSEEGIMFAPSLQREMMRVGQADRYGSIYTQISREIAKMINRPERSVSGLFVAMDEEFHGSKLLDKDPLAYEDKVYENGFDKQEEIIESLQNVDLNRFDPAARTIMSLVKESLTRDSLGSQLPVTQEDISITNGACFDVLAYYMASVDNPRGDIKRIEVDGVPMLEKNHGSHTFMLLEETLFNGVKLPKGSLMNKGSDGGWVFLRLTPLSLESEEDQKAAGSEIAKVLHNEQRLVARIGGFSLEAMQKRLYDRQLAGVRVG